MAKLRNREEAVNTQLAILISKYGVTADAETIHLHGSHRPDVVFQLRGLRVVIEGKFADTAGAEGIVLDDARKRVRNGIAHIAAAAIYPKNLRTTPTTELIPVLEQSQLRYRIISESSEGEGWYEGSPLSLMDALRRAQDALIEDDIVEKTAKALSDRLDGVAKLWMGQAGSCDRLSRLLGILPPTGETPEKAEERRETAARVSALVLANALIFQEQLAATDGRISSLKTIEGSSNTLEAVGNHWRWIWQNINYVPIFQMGERVINELPLQKNTYVALRALITEAKAICSQQSSLRHDLMGRIYHWLLHQAKHLGTYYTAVSSATLLLKLTMSSDWNRDFGDPSVLASFKVGDLACGTGTLLMATAQALSDIYIRERAKTGRSLNSVDLQTLHRALIENVLHGYDVLPSAVHLTASTLAMLAPEVAFVRMNLFVMPFLMERGIARLGSLDFIDTDEVKTQISLDYSQAETLRAGASFTQITNAKVPRLDLCVMNPPFVRSVGGNLLFGSLPDTERAQLQSALKKQCKHLSASITAGLGSVFVALADKRTEPGGRLAFVLPAALLSGEAWKETRNLINTRYHLEKVISSHDSERQNFSENTDLSEVMFIARKLKSGQKPSDTTYINLWRNPRSIHEAIDLANRIENSGVISNIEDSGITVLKKKEKKLGEIFKTKHPVGIDNWTGGLFAQTELFRTAWELNKGRLVIPNTSDAMDIPLCRLEELGALGPDRKRIHEGFKVSVDDWSPFAAFWGHESSVVRTIKQKPNAYLMAWKESPRGSDYGEHLWQRSGRILLAERLRSNTHRVLAVGFDQLVLGNTWWTLKLSDGSIRHEKALLLWINSSLSILSFFCRRVATHGAWMQMKQPAWEGMPMLDVRKLSDKQLDEMAASYDLLSKTELAPVAQLDKDLGRYKIDEAVSSALGLPSLTSIRELLGREPGLTGRDVQSLRPLNIIAPTVLGEAGQKMLAV